MVIIIIMGWAFVTVASPPISHLMSNISQWLKIVNSLILHSLSWLFSTHCGSSGRLPCRRCLVLNIPSAHIMRKKPL